MRMTQHGVGQKSPTSFFSLWGASIFSCRRMVCMCYIEKLCGSIKSVMSDQKQIEILKAAVKIYTGKLFPNGDGDLWHISFCMKYHSLYIKAFEQLMGLLNKTEDYKALHDYSMRAINVDPNSPMLM